MSVDLWKTLRIWSEQVATDPQVPFERRFTIITTAQAPDGSAAELLRPTRPSADAETAALILLKEAATKSTNKESLAGRTAFLGLAEQDRINLLAAIRIHDNAPNITDVRSEIEEQLFFSAPDGKVSNLVDHLEGWWFTQVVKALTDSSASAISLLALRAKVDEIARAFRNSELLINPETLAVTTDALPTADDRTFVRQMRSVEVDEDSIELAKLDFYRATAQRSSWARENALLDGEAARFDANLVERWKRERLARQSKGKPLTEDEKKDFGRDLFHWANRQQEPFRNRHEQWLCTGSYQILADGVTVGWHPEHSTMFSTLTKGQVA